MALDHKKALPKSAALRGASKIASRIPTKEMFAPRDPLHDPKSQVGGGHYRDEEIICPHCRGPLQLWDVLRFTFFNEGAAIKHVFRHRKKNKLQDLIKAKQYIDKIIATEYPEHPHAQQQP